MQTENRPVLVTGGRGGVGRSVVRGLLDAGVRVRASSRDPRPGSFPAEVEPARLDLTEPDSLRAALDGVGQVFLYAEPDEIEGFVAAATAAGVEHVVLLSSASVLLPDPEGNPIARRHLAVERALDASGLDRTFLRPAYFATNTLRWTSIRTERRVRTAFPEGRTATVHERDMADVAVAALLDDTHRGRAHALLGAGRSTLREQVAAIAEAIAEPVEVEEVPVDEYRQQLLAQMPEPIVDRLLRQRGDAPVPPPEVAVDAVQDVLGRPPLPYSTWARDHAADFR